MAHQIATSVCWPQPGSGGSPVALFVAFLDQQGNAHVFQQVPGGVWSGPGALSPPPGMPNLRFTLIAGFNNFLIALGNDGNLYGAVFSQTGSGPKPTDWSAFTPFPSLFAVNAGMVRISDFSVVEIAGAILIVAAFNVPAAAGFFSYNLPASSTPVNLAQNIQNNPNGWNLIVETSALDGVKGASSPALAVIYRTSDPTVALIGVPPFLPNDPNLTPIAWPASWSSKDQGLSWTMGNLSQVILLRTIVANSMFIPTSILITPGNPNSMLQAIMLVDGQPALCYSSDGITWAYYGDLLPLANTTAPPTPGRIVNPPTFLKAAAGLGNSHNLQLVGIGPTVFPNVLPYLIWQGGGGAWHLFPYDPNTAAQELKCKDRLNSKWLGTMAPCKSHRVSAFSRWQHFRPPSAGRFSLPRGPTRPA